MNNIKEQHKIQTFGRNFTRLQSVELDACTRCGACLQPCPVYDVVSQEGITARGKIQKMKTLTKTVRGPIIFPFSRKRSMNENATKQFVEEIYHCTMCGGCKATCEVWIDTIDMWKTLRWEICEMGLWPEALKKLSASIENTGNIFGRPAKDRLIWTWEDQKAEELTRGRVGKTAKIAYFVGCNQSYKGAYNLNAVPKIILNIMNSVGMNYTILGSDEWCCGNPMFLGGGFKLGEAIARKNVKQLGKLGVETLVTACPGCYKSWKIEYPEVLGEHLDFEILHVTEFIAGLLDKNKIKFTNRIEKNVTYHDPCELGRYCGIYESPRKIIENIPGINFNELDENKENCRCCGAGGFLLGLYTDSAKKIGFNKLEKVKNTGANMLVSACPVCKLHLSDLISEKELAIEMVDVVELVADAMNLN
jgi:heterodisulfide reductase subunit D